MLCRHKVVLQYNVGFFCQPVRNRDSVWPWCHAAMCLQSYTHLFLFNPVWVARGSGAKHQQWTKKKQGKPWTMNRFCIHTFHPWKKPPVFILTRCVWDGSTQKAIAKSRCFYQSFSYCEVTVFITTPPCNPRVLQLLEKLFYYCNEYWT